MQGGELRTRPFKFTCQKLSLNFATSAAGSLQVELSDAEGQPLPGFSLSDSDEHFGDSLDRTVTWQGNTDVLSLAGNPVRLRFRLRDAEIYSFQFVE